MKTPPLVLLIMMVALAILLAACGNVAFTWECDEATGRCEGEARYVTWTLAPTLQTATDTPTPSSTATASPPPVTTATTMPSPTITPVPPDATPTQETTPVPTVIPLPTLIPGPGCRLLTGSGDVQNIRVRTGPGTGYPLSAIPPYALAYNTEVQVFAAYEEPPVPGDPDRQTYVWARLSPNGQPPRWIAFYDALWGRWWARALSDYAEFCSPQEVPGWPTWLEIPPDAVAYSLCVGFHTKTPGVDLPDLRLALDALVGGEICPAVKSVEDMAWREAQARGGLGYYRPWSYGDCADMTKDPVKEADRRADFLIALSRGLGTTYLEADNECPYQEDLAWFNVYGVRLLTRAHAAGLHLIFPTQGPGYWNQDEIARIGPVLDAILETGACFGYHAYAVTPGVRVVDSGIWLGFRHRLIRRWMMAVDRRYANIPFCATEVGTGAGGEFDLSDFVEFHLALAQDTFIEMTAWWTAGQWFGYSMNGRMAEAARAFIQAWRQS